MSLTSDELRDFTKRLISDATQWKTKQTFMFQIKVLITELLSVFRNRQSVMLSSWETQVFLRTPSDTLACSCGMGSSSWTQTEVFALRLRLEAVCVAATAAVPEVGASPLFAVEEPLHGVIGAAAAVIAEATGTCVTTGDRRHHVTFSSA